MLPIRIVRFLILIFTKFSALVIAQCKSRCNTRPYSRRLNKLEKGLRPFCIGYTVGFAGMEYKESLLLLHLAADL